MKKSRFALIVSLFLVSGCAAISQGDKLINEQNLLAGKFVAEHAQVPDVKQAGDDIVLNTLQLTKVIGVPDDPAGEYTPRLSAAARTRSEDEHSAESQIYDFLTKTVGAKFPWALAAVSVIEAGWLFLKKRVQDKKVIALYNGVEDVKAALKNGKFDMATVNELINTLMRNKAVVEGVAKEINDDLKTLKAAGTVKTG